MIPSDQARPMRLENPNRDDSAPFESGRSRRKQVRLDKPTGPILEPPPEPRISIGNRSLFERILKAFKPDDADRRGARRHVAVMPEVWIGWWAGKEFETFYGRLLNLSRGGALVVLGEWPPKNQSIWVYKHVGQAIACVRGEVVGATPAPFGSYAIRVRFAAPCPTSFCESAVCEGAEKKATAGA